MAKKKTRTEILAKHDPDFEQDLEKSKEAQERAIRWLNFEGYTVIAPPVQCRPDIKKRAAFSDKGDLFILKGCEIKRRSLEFTCREDFPYPTIFIDIANNFDKKTPKPETYLIFCQDMSHAVFVDVRATRDQWTKTTKWDRGRNRTLYECPIDDLVFKPFPTELLNFDN